MTSNQVVSGSPEQLAFNPGPDDEDETLIDAIVEVLVTRLPLRYPRQVAREILGLVADHAAARRQCPNHPGREMDTMVDSGLATCPVCNWIQPAPSRQTGALS